MLFCQDILGCTYWGLRCSAHLVLLISASWRLPEQATYPTAQVDTLACAGERGSESNRARKQPRTTVAEPGAEGNPEPDEKEEEAEAAALAKLKGKKKARVQE